MWLCTVSGENVSGLVGKLSRVLPKHAIHRPDIAEHEMDAVVVAA